MNSTGRARLGDDAVLASAVLSRISVSTAAVPGSDHLLSENRYYGAGWTVLSDVARLVDSTCSPPSSGVERRRTYEPYRVALESAPAGIGGARWPRWLLDVVVRNTAVRTTDALSLRRFGGPTTRVPNSSSARPHLWHETPRRRRRREAYEKRMEFLQEEARQEGYTLNLASRRDFERFALGADDVRKGGLVLLENGNLRAIWRGEQGARLGLQFLGGGMVQYVIFKGRRGKRPVSRVAGRDSLEGLERQLAAFDMRSLVYE